MQFVLRLNFVAVQHFFAETNLALLETRPIAYFNILKVVTIIPGHHPETARPVIIPSRRFFLNYRHGEDQSGQRKACQVCREDCSTTKEVCIYKTMPMQFHVAHACHRPHNRL